MHPRLKHPPKNAPPCPICLPLGSPALRLLPVLQQTSVRQHWQRAGPAKALTLPKDYNHGPDVIALSTAPFTHAGPEWPLSSSHPAHDHGESSTTKRPFFLVCHGVEQLLKMIEGFLSTPLKEAVSLLNIFIDVAKVCSHLAESRCTD
jgi:hypothetical protein